jgi:hypothetical protein
VVTPPNIGAFLYQRGFLVLLHISRGLLGTVPCNAPAFNYATHPISDLSGQLFGFYDRLFDGKG